MSQVSCGDFRLGARLVHRVLEALERPAERAVVRREIGHDGRQSRTDGAGPYARQEQRQAQACVGDAVAMTLWLALNQA